MMTYYGHGHVVRGGEDADRTISDAAQETILFGFKCTRLMISNDGANPLRVWLDNPAGAAPHASRTFITVGADSGIDLQGHVAEGVWVQANGGDTTVEIIAFERGL